MDRPIPHLKIKASFCVSTSREQVDFVCKLFARYDKPWAICGGWALSLWLGRQIRPHGDIDIAVFRRDNDDLYGYLSEEWTLNYIDAGVEYPWTGELLQLPIHQIRGRNQTANLDSLELLMNDASADTWLFRRNQNITYPISNTILYTPDNIPIIAPEVALLFKAKYNDEPKSDQDFQFISPNLNNGQRSWLKSSLTVAYPDHIWTTNL